MAAPTFVTPPAITDDRALEQALPALSNWGRWGKEDQLGTLNFLSAEKRLAAAALIRTGRVVPLGREFSPTTPELRNFSYRMQRYEDALPEESGSLDTVGMTCHGFAITHVDALCHMFTPEGRESMYNGHPIEAVTPEGALKLGIEHAGALGIVGRGVLLDVAAVRGGALPLGTAIAPEELEAAERRHGVRAGEGDILFVRNGAGSRNTYRHGTGLHAACLPWLHERRVAVLSSDSDSDAHPPIPGFARWAEPIHMVGIPYLGLTLLDHAELDGLAAACAEEGRWAFFVTVAPWRFKGGTGSAVNPLAMF
ncbi:cyclase family protein [Roseomonas sp. OT10]|uniref:cyclase family protein n=1 Tax=Roseomonas cutis TaxID=2897332 RepID=UPI001E2DD23F|nr:cyclase family protein [Roseomonas sp. OT10]UFN47741.1 cyclase family protein [Roseomonas sp. OT10]